MTRRWAPHSTRCSQTDLAGMPLRTPVMLAAGTAGTLGEMADILDLGRVGGLVTKSITPEPREGNAPWRVAPLKAACSTRSASPTPASSGSPTTTRRRPPPSRPPSSGPSPASPIDDYVRVAAEMDEIEAIPAVELNVSCPNVKHGVEIGRTRGCSPSSSARSAPSCHTRLIVKLPPVTTHAALDHRPRPRLHRAGGGAHARGPQPRPGCDALSLCNTTPGMAIDVRTREPKSATAWAGSRARPSTTPSSASST
jgi:dihydroorotate dehydrogenase (NAD+) catalytic subunit